MANRLNVLVGAELASDVTKKLNAAIKDCVEDVDLNLGISNTSKKTLVNEVKGILEQTLKDVFSTSGVDFTKKLPNGFKDSIRNILLDAVGVSSEELKKDIESIVETSAKSARDSAKHFISAEKEKQAAIAETNKEVKASQKLQDQKNEALTKEVDALKDVNKGLKDTSMSLKENAEQALRFRDVLDDIQKKIEKVGDIDLKVNDLSEQAKDAYSKQIQIGTIDGFVSGFDDFDEEPLFFDEEPLFLHDRLNDEIELLKSSKRDLLNELTSLFDEASRICVDGNEKFQKREALKLSDIGTKIADSLRDELAYRGTGRANDDDISIIEKALSKTLSDKSFLDSLDSREEQLEREINYLEKRKNEIEKDIRKFYKEYGKTEDEFLNIVTKNFEETGQDKASLPKIFEISKERRSQLEAGKTRSLEKVREELNSTKKLFEEEKRLTKESADVIVESEEKKQDAIRDTSEEVKTTLNVLEYDALKNKTDKSLLDYEKLRDTAAYIAEGDKKALETRDKRYISDFMAKQLEDEYLKYSNDLADFESEIQRIKQNENKIAEDSDTNQIDLINDKIESEKSLIESYQKAIDVQKEAQRISEQSTDNAVQLSNKENISVLENEVRQREKIAKQEEKIVENTTEDIEDSEERKQKAIKNSTKEYENAVKSYQQVYDDAGDLAKESVKYDFKDGHTAKVETFYDLDEDGNKTSAKRITLDNKEEELAYKERLKLQEEYSKREGEIIAAQIDEQRQFYKEQENYKKTQAKKEEADLIAEGKRILESNKNKSIATENLEEKRQKVLLETVTVANEVEKSLRKIYDSSSVYDNSIYGYAQDRQLQSFEAELDDINKILSKDKVQLYEIIEAANRLNNLKIDSDKFGSDLSSSHDDYEKQIKSRKEAEKKAADDYVRFWEKAAVKLRERERKADEAAQKEENESFLKAVEDRQKVNQKISENDSRREQERIDLENQRKQLLQEIYATYDSVVKKYNDMESVDDNEFFDKTKINEFSASLDKLAQNIVDYENDAENLILVQKELNKLFDDVSSGQKISSKINSFNAQTERDIKSLSLQYGAAFDADEYRRIRDINTEIVRIIKEQGYSVDAVERAFKRVSNATADFKTDLRVSKKEIKEIEEQARVLNSSLGRFVQFYGFGQIFGAVKSAGRDVFEQITQIDASMVELKKVTDLTDGSYEKFLNNAYDNAKKLGVTMTDYIDSVTNFSRMDVGGFEAAKEVAEVANIFQQVSENLTADQASEYLISNMKAWGYEANEVIEIVDVLNNLDRGSQSEMPEQTLSFYRKTSRNGRPIPRIRLFCEFDYVVI